jgi:putative flippase GtrA
MAKISISSYKMTFQYTIVSLLATAADFSFFTIWGWLIKSPESIATFFSMLVGALVSWTMHRTWVFEKSTESKAHKRKSYLLGFMMSIGLNVSFMAVVADLLALPRMLSRIFTSLLVWVISYWFNRKIVFKV